MSKYVNSKKKIILTIISIILIILALSTIAIYMLFKTYLGKIESIMAESNDTTLSDEEIMQELLAEEVVTDASDSPEEDIAQLESQMEQQLEQQQKDQESNETFADENEIFNILLVGYDSRKKGGVGRSDAMILISANGKTEKIHMTSIMRDSYVSIPGKGNNRINAAYALGGGKLLLETIETNFAVDVDKYVAFDFYSFVDIVDSIGGIELEITEEELPFLNEYVRSLNRLYGRDEDAFILEESGLQHLNGTQALGYARIRYVGNGDFERTERQRTVITKVFEKVKTMNLLEMNELINVFLPEIKTNLAESEIVSLMFKVMTYLQYDLDSLRIPVEGSYNSMRVDGMAVLGIDLKKNQEALAEFIGK